uniref:15-cis-phytoene synthase n=1 Tax=Betaphycus gelatinus TaxID=1191690 RepID=A0A2D2AH16_9FLOR|nr:phytoene synthetase [Betaphycus gelatinus]
MVMERAPSARNNRLTLSPSENIDAIHDRLGIDKLWEANDLPTPPRHPSHLTHQPHSSSLRDTTSDDVTVVGDANPAARATMPWDTTTGAAMEFVRKRGLVLKKSYEECRRITALFSKTFYMGTTLFSEKKRRAIWAIYTWCRRTDDLVDGPRANDKGNELRRVLADWETRLEDIFRGKGRDALDLALVDTIANYPELSISPFQDMIKGMMMDIEQSTFETFDDLYLYCYRVAGTVGLMTLPIMGTLEPGRQSMMEATKPALALGIAQQLTNILRDVGEDRLRGRIYLPLEDLRRFNYTEEDLMNCVLDSRYKNLMKFEIARARRYYRQAQKGIALLDEESQLAVQASLDMYSQILDEIEENGYDNFNRRAYVSKTKKLLTVPISYMRTRQSQAWQPFLMAAESVMGIRRDV